MSYYLKKTKVKNGTYLQIYKNDYIPKKGNRGHSYKSFGYLEKLPENILIEAQKEVDRLNNESKKVEQIGSVSVRKNLGFFLIKSLFDQLNWEHDLKLMTQAKKFQFDLSDFIKTMVYAQIVEPGSKLNAYEKVIPNLYNSNQYSYDQMLDAINYIGMDYPKYIELLNQHIAKLIKRDTSNVFFDCTNYYFEIDEQDDIRKKGPSKENRKDPIIGQGLLLDSMQVPLGMLLYPGNESEMPKIRELIDDLKNRNHIEGRVVQVADKGLNCAGNIYTIKKESNDGYIFSKSIHGKNLSKTEKKWVRLSDSKANLWKTVKDHNGKVLYRYKSCVDKFEYSFTDKITGEYIEVTVKEKRLVTYNPSLAKKQRIEIRKEVDKAKKLTTAKSAIREDSGNCAKYISTVDEEGNGKKVKTILNEEQINEDLEFAGFNLIVTSEIDKPDLEIYDAYHGLWKIENSFRIMKSYLNARPVFVRSPNTIYGHFLIVYIALTLLRIIETYVFKLSLSTEQIVEFIRDYSITKNYANTYINNATSNAIYEEVKKVYGISCLGNLYLKEKDVNCIYETETIIDKTLNYEKYKELILAKQNKETKKQKKAAKN